LILITLFLTGCEAVKPSGFGLSKAEDKVTGVICYRMTGFEGIHCFTKKELN